MSARQGERLMQQHNLPRASHRASFGAPLEGRRAAAPPELGPAAAAAAAGGVDARGESAATESSRPLHEEVEARCAAGGGGGEVGAGGGSLGEAAPPSRGAPDEEAAAASGASADESKSTDAVGGRLEDNCAGGDVGRGSSDGGDDGGEARHGAAVGQVDEAAGGGVQGSGAAALGGGLGLLMVKAMDAKQRASLFMRHSELFQSRQDSFLNRLTVLAASCGAPSPPGTALSAARDREEALLAQGQGADDAGDAAGILDCVDAGRSRPVTPGAIGRDTLTLTRKLRGGQGARPAFGSAVPRQLAVYDRLSRDACVMVSLPARHQHEVPPQIPPAALGRPKSALWRGVTFSPLPTKGGKHRFAPMPYYTPPAPGQPRNIYALPRTHRFDQPPPRSPVKSAKMPGAAGEGARPHASAAMTASGLSTPSGRRSVLQQQGAGDELYDQLIPRPHQWRVVDSPMAAPYSPVRPHSTGQRPHSALGTSLSSGHGSSGLLASGRERAPSDQPNDAASIFPSSAGFRRLRSCPLRGLRALACTTAHPRASQPRARVPMPRKQLPTPP